MLSEIWFSNWSVKYDTVFLSSSTTGRMNLSKRNLIHTTTYQNYNQIEKWTSFLSRLFMSFFSPFLDLEWLKMSVNNTKKSIFKFLKGVLRLGVIWWRVWLRWIMNQNFWEENEERLCQSKTRLNSENVFNRDNTIRAK